MPDWTRRDVLRISAGAAVVAAVPITAATLGPAGSAAAPAGRADRLSKSEIERSGTGRVMLCVHDAAKGEVSLLQGTREVILKDHSLVAQIMRAAAPAGS